ncbi:MAG TPA: hypothetical protein VLH09_04695 [Bryobacteraceae bacterium]|nr:hypothetical protein [Bryobacteraceae bacterium]
MADEQTTQQAQQGGQQQAQDAAREREGAGAAREPNAAEAAQERTLTQSEVNAILKRERLAWQKAAEEERKKAEMTEAERLKAEKTEAEKRAADAAAAANTRIIKTEARAALADAGVKPERRDYALRMLDLSAIEAGETGDVDEKALRAAVETLLKDVPELKGPGSDAAGSEFGGSKGPLDPGGMTMPEYLAWRKKRY